MAARESEAPRVRVAALILIGGSILLVRQRKGGEPYYLLPGGGVKFGESLGDALLREVREETGLECRVGEPVLINDTIAPNAARHLVNITFLAETTGGTLLDVPSDPSIEGLDLVAPEELTALDLRPPLAEALLGVIGDSAPPHATYLGPVWTDE